MLIGPLMLLPEVTKSTSLVPSLVRPPAVTIPGGVPPATTPKIYCLAVLLIVIAPGTTFTAKLMFGTEEPLSLKVTLSPVEKTFVAPLQFALVVSQLFCAPSPTQVRLFTAPATTKLTCPGVDVSRLNVSLLPVGGTRVKEPPPWMVPE